MEPREGGNDLRENSGDFLGGSSAPEGQRSWAALGAVLATLGPLLAPLWAVLAPGGPGRLRGRAPGGHFGAFFNGPAQKAETATKKYILC